MKSLRFLLPLLAGLEVVGGVGMDDGDVAALDGGGLAGPGAGPHHSAV